MGDGFKKITRRLKRLFVAEEEKPTPKLSASQVIKPEEIIPQQGKPAPKTTTKRIRPPDLIDPNIKVETLPWGVVHVIFARPPVVVPVRDPITRRLDRRELLDGMKSQVIYYDKDGRLIE